MESTVGKKIAEARLEEYLSYAESNFASLLLMDDLDQRAPNDPDARAFELALAFALRSAFSGQVDNRAHHLFLQRVLYRINRLKFFWYDDLSNYDNERSDFLRQVRQRIESAWQEWELAQLAFEQNSDEAEVAESLRRRAAEDLAPTPSPEAIYFRDHMGMAGYRRLLQIASLMDSWKQVSFRARLAA